MLLRPDGSCRAPVPRGARRRGALRLPPYHAYAPDGAVAEAVFVNLGRVEDYIELERHGVACAATSRWRAAGAVAELIAGNADGIVERGVVLLGSPCDPLTPGWAATGGVERLGEGTQAAVAGYLMLTSTGLLDVWIHLISMQMATQII